MYIVIGMIMVLRDYGWPDVHVRLAESSFTRAAGEQIVTDIQINLRQDLDICE